MCDSVDVPRESLAVTPAVTDEDSDEEAETEKTGEADRDKLLDPLDTVAVADLMGVGVASVGVCDLDAEALAPALKLPREIEGVNVSEPTGLNEMVSVADASPVRVPMEGESDAVNDPAVEVGSAVALIVGLGRERERESMLRLSVMENDADGA